MPSIKRPRILNQRIRARSHGTRERPIRAQNKALNPSKTQSQVFDLARVRGVDPGSLGQVLFDLGKPKKEARGLIETVLREKGFEGEELKEELEHSLRSGYDAQATMAELRKKRQA